MLKRTHVQSIRNRNKVTLVCTRFYRVLRLVRHNQDHVVPGRCPSPVIPKDTLTQTFRSYMFPFVLQWEPTQNKSPKWCATFCVSLITQYTGGGQSRRASGDALWEATWERTTRQYFLFLTWRLISVYPTPIDKLQLLFSPLYKSVKRPKVPGLRRRSMAARLLRLWVRIPPGAWMSVCCECCVLSRRGLCDELTTRGILPNVVRRCVL